jgi:hypothetical protein
MLQKQAVSVNFAQGINTKLDPWQLPVGQFQSLVNSIFTTGQQLRKRNGYMELSALPNVTYTYLTTLNNNLTALGSNIAAYNETSSTWVPKGTIQPMQVSTLPVIRNTLNQTQCDSVIASNGLMLVTYDELNNSTTTYKYALLDSVTGQNIVAPTAIPAIASGTIAATSKPYIVGSYFVVITPVTVSGTTYLQYFSIPITLPATVPTPVKVTTEAYIATYTNPGWDAAVINNSSNNAMAIAYNTTSGGQGVHVASLTLSQIANAQTTSGIHDFTNAAYKGSLVSVCVDVSNPTSPLFYISFWNSSNSNAYTAAVSISVGVITAVFTPQLIASSITLDNITSAATGGSATVFGDVANTYGYDGSIATNFIDAVTVSSAGAVGTPFVSLRSVGLGSKAFVLNGSIYYLALYSSSYQPSYFLINGSTSTEYAPVIVGKLAYENGGGPLILGLPNVTVAGSVAQVTYLYKDFVTTWDYINDSQQNATPPVYSQTGINLGTFDFTSSGIDTAEIANTLNLSGGFLGMYDGYLPVEHNFFLWPDYVEATTATGSGAITAQQYYYQAIYEWTDNAGNIHRSAPSIPITITTTTSSSTNTIYVPTLRLTMKTANPVKIILYRWSTANQVYYQVTSVTAPTLNSTSTDYVTITDTLADSSIVGNSIIYTNGGVIEDVNAPATNIISLFDTRLWMVDAEDPNLLWYSKQVIEAVPVEMSDLLTYYIAPNTGTTQSTGPVTGLAPMDDKLVIFKRDSIFYINGSGPDNTGSNSQYSQPIFITSTVGCVDQSSIVLMQNGLMFQSDKGIWLLGRDLSTQYIGANVEAFNSSTVNSSNNIPATTQIRFTLSTGQTLMYDYYYQQWGTFKGVPAVSSCIYQNLHTFINGSGQVFQETPGVYMDGPNPVLMSFTTSWLNLAGLQGYQRAYFFYILGQYLTPHKLQLEIAYNYNSAIVQSSLITPNNFSSSLPSAFGVPTPFGSVTNVENWRVFLAQQRCQAFQITLNELYDATLGVPAGAGLTLSGLNIVTGFKKGFRSIGQNTSVGGGVNRG